MTYRGNGTRHAQRTEPKPKVQPTATNTAWIAPFMSSIEGMTDSFTAESTIAIQLGATPYDREQKLRRLSSMGLLTMHAIRLRINGDVAKLGEPSVFDHYEWTVA